MFDNHNEILDLLKKFAEAAESEARETKTRTSTEAMGAGQIVRDMEHAKARLLSKMKRMVGNLEDDIRSLESSSFDSTLNTCGIAAESQELNVLLGQFDGQRKMASHVARMIGVKK